MIDLWEKTVQPMLLDEIDKPFDSKDYFYELKFDGIRGLIYVSPSKFKIINRHERDITYLYPELKVIQKMVKNKVIFDGEIVCLDNGQPSFSKLQKRSHLKGQDKIKLQVINNPVTFICFDIIYEDKNLDNLDLIKRKKYLNKYQDNDYFVKTRIIKNKGIDFFKEIKKLNLEGIVAKKKNSKYKINTRTKEWIKIKNFRKETFYIGGYFYKETSHVFSVVLGEYINDKLSFVGKAFISKKNELFKLLKKAKPVKSKFINFDEPNISYLNPKYTCQIKYIERTENNNLRQPFYVKR